jgi:uncharacterized protein involved in exopolysaccharide biosynthesis
MYDANVTTESSVRLPSLLAPILERWRVLLLLTFGAAIAAGLFARLRAPRYVASMSVATITSSRTLNLGGAAALLGAGAAQGGFQLTPSLIADLMKSRRVLVPVGSALAPGSTETVASRIRGRTVEPVHVWENMQRAVSANVDQQTGLVEVDVTATDSALARFVADSVYEETTRAFVQTARAQASLQRRGQEARVYTNSAPRRAVSWNSCRRTARCPSIRWRRSSARRLIATSC